MASWIPGPAQVDGVTIQKTGAGIALRGAGIFPAYTTPVRALDVEYTNTGDYAREVQIAVSSSTGGEQVNVLVDGALAHMFDITAGMSNASVPCTFTVPAGSTYEVQKAGGGVGNFTLNLWKECAVAT